MLPQIALHLSDEDLLRLRDGEPVEARAQAHLEHCPLCQELLRAWRDFAEAIQAAREEEPIVAPVAKAKLVMSLAAEPSLAYFQTVDRLQEEVPPELPDAWLKRVLPGLRERPSARDLGRVRLHQEDNGTEVLMHEDPATGSTQVAREGQWPPEELALDLGRDVLRLSLRRAGHARFLIARLTRSGGAPVDSRDELAPIPARGELQVRILHHERYELAGTAWFRLPPGQPAELFVHRSRPPFRLRIEPDGDEV